MAIIAPFTFLAHASYAADLFGNNYVCNDPQAKAKNPAACQDSAGNTNPLYGKDGIITKIINILTIIVGIAAIFTIIFAGLKFITSGSNPQEVSKAREMIIYAVIGVFIAAIAQAIVRLVLSKL